MEESLEAKDIEAKYKGKAKQMDGKLKGEVAKLEAEKKNFQSNAQKTVKLGHNKNMVSYNKEIDNCNMLNKECCNNYNKKVV